MTFLEAYIWMSESEDNVCLRNVYTEYKVIGDNLRVKSYVKDEWDSSTSTIWFLNKSTWQKVTKKKVPETVELTLWGYVESSGRWIAMECAPKERPNSPYRKTDQTKAKFIFPYP